jgi:hypothetical protein
MKADLMYTYIYMYTGVRIHDMCMHICDKHAHTCSYGCIYVSRRHIMVANRYSTWLQKTSLPMHGCDCPDGMCMSEPMW